MHFNTVWYLSVLQPFNHPKQLHFYFQRGSLTFLCLTFLFPFQWLNLSQHTTLSNFTPHKSGWHNLFWIFVPSQPPWFQIPLHAWKRNTELRFKKKKCTLHLITLTGDTTSVSLIYVRSFLMDSHWSVQWKHVWTLPWLTKFIFHSFKVPFSLMMLEFWISNQKDDLHIGLPDPGTYSLNPREAELSDRQLCRFSSWLQYSSLVN